MLVLKRIHVNTAQSFSKLSRLMCSKSNNFNETSKTDKKKSEEEMELPPEPDNCCMSGCENCVWKTYAADLTDLYNDSGETARKIILEKIKDPSMQVFLKMELEFLDKKK